ncbi:MAG: radical SAM protein [Planctomycetota bacterium]
MTGDVVLRAAARAAMPRDQVWRNAVLDGPFVDKRELYRLPWSDHDNPIGWLEMTDACDLACKGCYRKQLEGHKPFEQIQEEIRFFQRHRNTDCIVMAGGEPTIHPRFLDVVADIDRLGMKPHMCTGGQRLLDPGFLKEMRKAGMEGMGVHVDAKQGRPGWSGATETELCALREEMAHKIAEAGGMNVGFGITVFRDTLEDVPELARWTVENRRLVGGFSFITYRGARIVPGMEWTMHGQPVEIRPEDIGYATREEQEAISITAYDVMRRIQEGVPEWVPCCYLGGTQSHKSVKWLIGVLFATRGKVLGSMGRKTMELAQALHHLAHGTYLVYSRGKHFPRAALLAGLVDPRIRRMWKHYLRNPLRIFQRLQGVGFGIVQAPDVLADGSIDMCDSCPDMTVYDGEFINSCRMDEYRLYGGPLTPIHRDASSPAAPKDEPVEV